MPISASEILYRLSVTTGSSGNSTGQANPNASLGTYMSTSGVTSGVLNNLFDNISGSENASSGVDYRCFFVYNSNTSGTLYSTVIWINNQVSGGASIQIGLDPTGNMVHNSTTPQATTIANESGVPAGVSFSDAGSQASGLSIGDLSPVYCRAVWVKRSANNSSAINNDGATFTVLGDTGA